MNKPITLITGTRKGIGKSLAFHYVNQGHQVIGCSREPVDWVLSNYQHILADVADEDAVLSLFKKIRKQYGRLDNLINNAGIASMNHFLLTPLSTVTNILNTNFVGTFLFCREAGKLMIKNNYGRIVNFTTVATPLKLEGGGLFMLHLKLQYALLQKYLRVNWQHQILLLIPLVQRLLKLT